MTSSRQLRSKAERLFVKAGRWWIGRAASRRLYHRACDYERAARLAERREREAR